MRCEIINNVALPGCRHGLCCFIEFPTTPGTNWSWRWCQHQSGLHALLVRTSGYVCLLQTDSSPRTRACQLIFSAYSLLSYTHVILTSSLTIIYFNINPYNNCQCQSSSLRTINIPLIRLYA